MSDNLPNNREVEQDSESCGKIRKSRSRLMLVLLAVAIGLPALDGSCRNSSSDNRETPKLRFDFIEEVDKDLQSSATGAKDNKVKEDKPEKQKTDPKPKKHTRKKPVKEGGHKRDDDDFPPQTVLA